MNEVWATSTNQVPRRVFRRCWWTKIKEKEEGRREKEEGRKGSSCSRHFPFPPDDHHIEKAVGHPSRGEAVEAIQNKPILLQDKPISYRGVLSRRCISPVPQHRW